MRKLLVAINVLLVFTILGVAFFFNPETEQAPMPGTHAARVGSAVPQAAMAPASSSADGTAGRQVGVSEAHVRLVPPGAKVTGAFMTLKNAGEREARLVSAATPVARVTELHSHGNDDGVMRMRQVGEIVVPARGTVQLKPGSYHLMLIDLQTALQEGDPVPITLGFADGSSLMVDVPVVRPSSGVASRH